MERRNAALLREIADVIDTKPGRYNQSRWEGWYTNDGCDFVADWDLIGWGSTAPVEQGVAHVLEVTDPNAGCGSTFCIAGWAIALSATPDELKRAAQACVYEDVNGAEFVDYTNHDIALCAIVGERLGLHAIHSVVAGALLGLTLHERSLFDGEWQPAGTDEDDPYNDPHLVAAALRRLADGASLGDVTFDPDGYFDDDED